MLWFKVLTILSQYVLFPIAAGLLTIWIARCLDRHLPSRRRCWDTTRRKPLRIALTFLFSFLLAIILVAIGDCLERYRPRIYVPEEDEHVQRTFDVAGEAGTTSKDQIMYVVTHSLESVNPQWFITDQPLLSPNGYWRGKARDCENVPIGGQLQVYVLRGSRPATHIGCDEPLTQPPFPERKSGMSDVVTVTRGPDYLEGGMDD